MNDAIPTQTPSQGQRLREGGLLFHIMIRKILVLTPALICLITKQLNDLSLKLKKHIQGCSISTGIHSMPLLWQYRHIFFRKKMFNILVLCARSTLHLSTPVMNLCQLSVFLLSVEIGLALPSPSSSERRHHSTEHTEESKF